jgi:hypothetical protein
MRLQNSSLGDRHLDRSGAGAIPRVRDLRLRISRILGIWGTDGNSGDRRDVSVVWLGRYLSDRGTSRLSPDFPRLTKFHAPGELSNGLIIGQRCQLPPVRNRSVFPRVQLSFHRRKVQRFRACKPASPACLEPGLPTHITLQSTPQIACSSKMSSTACPRLSRKVPPTLNPLSELSRMMHGTLSSRRPRFTTRPARFF